MSGEPFFASPQVFFLIFFSLLKFTLAFYTVNTTQVLALEYSFIDSILTFVGYILNHLWAAKSESLGKFLSKVK